MLWAEVETRINRAIEIFIAEDSYLIEVNANERSMTHKLACHLQAQFPYLHVDCEFNRLMSTVKALRLIPPESISTDDTEGTTIYPDIIIHRRGTDENLIAIEAKKDGIAYSRDTLKLRALQSDSAFAYQHAVLMFFLNSSPPRITFSKVPTI